MNSLPNCHRLRFRDGNQGWQARFIHRGGNVNRFFNDRYHGGAHGARDAALRWLRKQRRRLGLPKVA
jgi:hypothetical protein